MIQKFKTNPALLLGLFLVLALILLELLLLIGAPFSLEMHMEHRLEPPSSDFWLGTDGLGRDLLSSIIAGTWVSLGIGLVVNLVAGGVGFFLGMVAGYFGGKLDFLIMRGVDALLSIPGILFGMVLASLWGVRLEVLILVLILYCWAGYVRIIRAEVLRYKSSDFIQAAVGFNATPWWIMRHHLLPLLRPIILVQGVVGMSAVILTESGLNFLGLGLGESLPSLGGLIYAGQQYLWVSPQISLCSATVLFLLILSLNLMVTGIRKSCSG